MPEETKTTQPEQQPVPEPNPDPKPDPKPTPEPAPEPAPPEKQDTPQSAQNAPESPGADEAASLRAQLARANAERTAAIEAVKLGIDPKQVPYVLRLAELPDSGKAEDIAAALQKVLDDVPAFKTLLKNADTITRTISVDGGASSINRNVTRLDEVTIRTVPSARFKTAYDFTDGCKPAANAQQINAMLVHPSCVVSRDKYSYILRSRRTSSAWGRG